MPETGSHRSDVSKGNMETVLPSYSKLKILDLQFMSVYVDGGSGDICKLIQPFGVLWRLKIPRIANTMEAYGGRALKRKR